MTSSLRGVGADLQAHDAAAAPPAQFALDQLQVRSAALVVELQLGVAREADDGRLQNRLSGKQQRDVRAR